MYVGIVVGFVLGFLLGYGVMRSRQFPDVDYVY